MLRDAGVGEVMVALLGPHDVGEDEAAMAVAQSLLGASVAIGPASTGRVNLFAEHAGLLVLDAAAIDALNAVSEDVTLATLPQLAPVQAGAMVATVKIIPFAVPNAVIRTCLEAGMAARIRVAAFRPMSVHLIHTINDGLKESVVAKTSSVTADRLARLGGVVAREARCEHSAEALAPMLREAVGEGCDAVLVIGASAIVDRLDVIPAAITALDGRIVRLGMPVDPGNLILLGQVGETPVLGLPGCARSPARNGLDWVLERMAAGVAVGADEIAKMGVGGLLIGREEEKDYL
jgi:molybdenum cofactor cytidylyltransferase